MPPEPGVVGCRPARRRRGPGVGLVLLIVPLLVAAAAADSGPRAAAADSVQLSPAGTDTIPAPAGVSPRGALLRSLAVPGWGQLANGRPYKAGMFAAAAGAVATWAALAQRDLNRVDTRLRRLRQQDPGSALIPAVRQEQQDMVARRNTRALYTVAAATVAALDAYVDAHLADFAAAVAAGDRPLVVSAAAAGGGALGVSVAPAGSNALGVCLRPGGTQLLLCRRW